MAEEYVTASGASLTYPLECGQVKKGGHVLIRGFPCKVSLLAALIPQKKSREKIRKKKCIFLSAAALTWCCACATSCGAVVSSNSAIVERSRVCADRCARFSPRH